MYEEAYIAGLIDKCAELGVDPDEFLCKQARPGPTPKVMQIIHKIMNAIGSVGDDFATMCAPGKCGVPGMRAAGRLKARAAKAAPYVAGGGLAGGLAVALKDKD